MRFEGGLCVDTEADARDFLEEVAGRRLSPDEVTVSATDQGFIRWAVDIEDGETIAEVDDWVTDSSD